MVQLGNWVGELTAFRLEARKPFSFALWVREPNGAPVDLTGCSIVIVMSSAPLGTILEESTNLITNSDAVLVDPTHGYSRFDLQAGDLDAAAGEYPFVIVLTTNEGYAAAIVKGVIELVENAEWGPTDAIYSGGNPVDGLDVTLRGTTTVEVNIGSVLPPGQLYLTAADKANLDLIVQEVLQRDPLGSAAYKNIDFFAPADAVVPPGGYVNRLLGKRSSADYDLEWLNPLGLVGASGLNATGIPANKVPISQGSDLWDWGNIVANAEDMADGATKVVMTVAERSKLALIQALAEVNVTPDWTAISGDAAIINKPVLGTAAAQNTGYFAAAGHGHRVIELQGISRGTADPAGGVDGDLYIKYYPVA